MVGEVSEKWSKIKKLLFENYESDKILCPFSLEFFAENTGLRKEKAKLIESEFSTLTGGYCFKPEIAIYCQEIVSKIRGNRITKKTYLAEKENSIFEPYENRFEELKKLNNEFSENVIKASEESNQMATEFQHVKLEKEIKDGLFESLIKENIEDFVNRLNNLIKNNSLIPEDTETSLGQMESWIDSILYLLITKHRMRLKEFKKLRNFIKSQGFSRFPALDVRFRLFSLISVNNKKTMPNDAIDIMRISTGFSISDIFITDKQRKSEIVELKFFEKYKTKVFSGTKLDLDLIIEELEKIKNYTQQRL